MCIDLDLIYEVLFLSSDYGPFGRSYASWLNGFIACIVCEAKALLLGIPGFPPGMPYGFVRILFFFFSFFFFFLFFFFFFFLFFRRQGFRMITFDRQAGPLQNFNRSHIMVIGRSVSFSDPARPPGGGVGRPKHPKIPPPPKNKFLFACVSEPQEHFWKKKFSREKKLAPPPPSKKKILFFIFWAF